MTGYNNFSTDQDSRGLLGNVTNSTLQCILLSNPAVTMMDSKQRHNASNIDIFIHGRKFVYKCFLTPQDSKELDYNNSPLNQYLVDESGLWLSVHEPTLKGIPQTIDKVILSGSLTVAQAHTVIERLMEYLK